MCELVDDQDRWSTRKRGIKIELLSHDTAIAHRHRRKALDALRQPFGFDTSMWLDVADHDVSPSRPSATRCFQHCVSLTDARYGTEKYTQPSPSCPNFLSFDLSQQLIGIGPCFGHRLFHLRSTRVEREVQFQHIHARLAEQADSATLGCGGNQLSNCGLWKSTCARDSQDLVFRRGG